MSQPTSIDEARRLAKAAKRNSLQDKFLEAWKATGWPMPSQEVLFDTSRKWRLDFYWCDPCKWQLGVELHGGAWQRGHHTRAKDQADDFDKLNAAAKLGITMLQFSTVHMADPAEVCRVIQETMAALSR